MQPGLINCYPYCQHHEERRYSPYGALRFQCYNFTKEETTLSKTVDFDDI